METFSKRNKLVPEKAIQINDIDRALFNRLWNIFYERERTKNTYAALIGIDIVEDILDEFGLTYLYPDDIHGKDNNIEDLREFLIDNEWYYTYDFLELYVGSFNFRERRILEKTINEVLVKENSGYRMIKGIIASITNESEIESLKKAMSTKYDTVNTHFKKALELYSKRKNPDYENSIKESISAIEALCCIITETKGGKATLGKALKKLKDKGVYIHPAMENAFLALYGYTSDGNGIRHGSIGESNVEQEDAKFMLVSCSAFANYLIEKLAK